MSIGGSDAHVEEARTLLLSAAQAAGKLTAVSALGLLDGEGTRDPQYQLALIDLSLEPAGDGQAQRFVMTSYFQRTEDEPIASLAEPPVGFEPDVLAWAKRSSTWTPTMSRDGCPAGAHSSVRRGDRGMTVRQLPDSVLDSQLIFQVCGGGAAPW